MLYSDCVNQLGCWLFCPTCVFLREQLQATPQVEVLVKQQVGLAANGSEELPELAAARAGPAARQPVLYRERRRRGPAACYQALQFHAGFEE